MPTQNATDPSRKFFETLRSKETSELIDLMKSKAQAVTQKRNADNSSQDPELAAIEEILSRRQARVPDLTVAEQPVAKPINRKPMAVDTNATIGHADEDKIELHFPKKGFMRCEKSHFKNEAELLAYISEALLIEHRRDSMRLKVKRKGKYQRIDRMGAPVFTFGDPVLDLITDEHGLVSVGNETYNMLRMHLAASGGRKGGISSIDLSLLQADIQRHQVIEAMSPNGKYALLEYNSERTVIASTNPSSRDFTHGSARMRFRSWKHSYVLYKSIGSEIETWGHDFSSASIRSTYADPVVSSNPFICAIVKTDSDSDTNDDYVDEYEWAVNASPASTVSSFCQARWFDQTWGGNVSKGDCATFL
jgi:hypothetical protein